MLFLLRSLRMMPRWRAGLLIWMERPARVSTAIAARRADLSQFRASPKGSAYEVNNVLTCLPDCLDDVPRHVVEILKHLNNFVLLLRRRRHDDSCTVRSAFMRVASQHDALSLRERRDAL